VVAPVRLSRFGPKPAPTVPESEDSDARLQNAFLSSSGWSSYDVSKAALVASARGLALEFAALGILVNSVAPGYVRSPRARSSPLMTRRTPNC
jgi:NAD(P)-dependent dehydrogenase (short-subunit alcohol dehydrogenase family)